MCKSANNGCLLRYHVKYLGEAELMKDGRRRALMGNGMECGVVCAWWVGQGSHNSN